MEKQGKGLFSTRRRDGSTYSKIHRAIARRPSKARNRKDICAPDTPRIKTTSQPLSAEGHEFALTDVSSSQMGIGKHVLLHRNTEDHPDPPTGAFCRKIQEIGTPGAEVGGKVSLHTQCYKPCQRGHPVPEARRFASETSERISQSEGATSSDKTRGITAILKIEVTHIIRSIHTLPIAQTS
jgi:hypothetical protein